MMAKLWFKPSPEEDLASLTRLFVLFILELGFEILSNIGPVLHTLALQQWYYQKFGETGTVGC
jgi:hypothetical protein